MKVITYRAHSHGIEEIGQRLEDHCTSADLLKLTSEDWCEIVEAVRRWCPVAYHFMQVKRESEEGWR